MAIRANRYDRINGQVKFSSRITRDELIELAIEFRTHDEYGDKFKMIGVREYDPNQFAIVFSYMHHGVDSSFKKFVYKMTDQLKRRFGNDLIGWDITSAIWLIE